MLGIVKKLARRRWDFLPSHIRFGREQTRLWDQLLKSQWWDIERLRAYQWTLLERLIEHAYHNSPFYRRRFDSIGMKPEDCRTFADYQKIPCLTKSELKEQLDEIKCRNFDKYPTAQIRTGGSTGAPLIAYKSINCERMRVAVAWRALSMAAVSHRQRRIRTDNTFLFEGVDDVSFEVPRYRTIYVRTYHTNRELFQLFVRLCDSYRPQFLQGNIGFYREFGRYLTEESISTIRPGAILVVGETVTDKDRENIREWFGCKLFDFYGMRENTVSAGDCERGKMHVNSEFVYLEFENEQSPAAPGELAGIIGTNLLNFAVPMIRYDTGDMGRYYSEHCDCGRGLPIMKIEGGQERDFIVTSRGLVCMTWHILLMIDKSIGVDKIQVYQPDRKRLIARVVRNRHYQNADDMKIIAALSKLVQGELDVTVEYVDDIPRTKLGKYRIVVSDVAPT